MLKERLFATIFSFFILSFVTQDVSASTIEFLAFIYPPLIEKDGTGIAQRIIDAAAQEQGFKTKYTLRPRKRAILMFKESDTKIFLGEKRYFPDLVDKSSAQTLFYLHSVLVYLADKYPDFNFTRFENLKGKRIGLSIGSNLTATFKSVGAQVEETLSLDNNLKKLEMGRIDFWGTTDMTALDRINKLFPLQADHFVLWKMGKFSAEVVVKNGSPAENQFRQLSIGLNKIVKMADIKRFWKRSTELERYLIP